MKKLLIIFIISIFYCNVYADNFNLQYAQSKFRKIYEKEIGINMASMCTGNEIIISGTMLGAGNVEVAQQHSNFSEMFFQIGAVILGSEEQMRDYSSNYAANVRNLSENDRINLMKKCLAIVQSTLQKVSKVKK